VGDVLMGACFRPLWRSLPGSGGPIQQASFWLKFFWELGYDLSL